MKPLVKLFGALAILIASGSVLALEGSIFSLITVADPADWMLLCGLVIVVAIAYRKRIPTQMGMGASHFANHPHGPNGTDDKRK